jgi:two-component system, NtrC family, response regulator AtoC
MTTRAAALLLHAPEAAREIAAHFDDIARVVTSVDRGAFLSSLPGTDWRVVMLAIEDESDLRLLPRIAGEVPSAILVATHPAPVMELVLEAEAAGAAFLLPHPPDPGALRDLLAPYLLEHADHSVPEDDGDEDRVVGTSAALTEAYRTVARVAASTAPVLIEGESGTGKELVAKALHRRSRRSGRPFVAVNCAALPEGLLEAELFGYERGAFTGAVGRSEGRFGRANGGTLFLDEVGEMGLGLQAKLLRALETGEIDRLGGTETVRVDVRIVAATNRNLEERVREGAFREDLLYRLAVVRVGLPPLRARMEDLVPLVETFVSRFARRHDRSIHALSSRALEELEGRSWPGNVRELRNVIDRAVLLARGGVVRSIDLAEALGAPSFSALETDVADGYAPTLSLREVEERHIRRVLAATGGHLGEAAEILGVHRNTMTAKVRDYGIDPQRPEALNPGGGRE